MKPHTLDEFKIAMCPVARQNNTSMATLLTHTFGMPCVSGCIMFCNGGCKSYQVLEHGAALCTVAPLVSESAKAAAARLGISINEVRRIRKGV